MELESVKTQTWFVPSALNLMHSKEGRLTRVNNWNGLVLHGQKTNMDTVYLCLTPLLSFLYRFSVVAGKLESRL